MNHIFLKKRPIYRCYVKPPLRRTRFGQYQHAWECWLTWIVSLCHTFGVHFDSVVPQNLLLSVLNNHNFMCLILLIHPVQQQGCLSAENNLIHTQLTRFMYFYQTVWPLMSWLVHPLKRFKYQYPYIEQQMIQTAFLGLFPLGMWAALHYAKTCIHILSNKWYKQEVEEHSGEARYKPALVSGFAIVWRNQIQECIRVWLRMSVLALRKHAVL